MAYIPSSALATVLDKARVGFWIDSLHDGRTALVCKMPETVIKALYRGAKCSFLIAVVKAEGVSIMCLGLRVQDEPDNPFTATIPSISTRDIALVKEILTTRSTTLHCLNEFNHPVFSAGCLLEPVTSQSALDGLNSTNPYVSPKSEVGSPQPSDVLRVVELVMDRFQVEIYRTADDYPSEFIEATGRIPVALDPWDIVEVFEVNPTLQGGPFRIDDKDEGKKQEKSLHLLIDTVFPGNTHRSPKVQDGSSIRELTDVLGFDGDLFCLLESKGMSILTAAADRSSQRRAATVTKHVEKALRQLNGALRSIRSDSLVYDTDRQPITLPGRETLPAHAIVVLSEMYAFLDWRLIARKVIASSENDRSKAFFHVVDLSELSYLTKISKDGAAFNNYLIQRWLSVKLKGTAYVRAKVPAETVEHGMRPLGCPKG